MPPSLVRTLKGLAGLGLAGGAYQAVATVVDRRRYPPPGRLVDVGGHRLHIDCQGEGSPAVIIQAGGATSSLEWRAVAPEVAKGTRVCVYDRAGCGWSDPGPNPRTSQRNADELRALLVNAGIEGPYVLVGHSIGGLMVRHYGYLYPDDVAGLVLVDSSHEDQFSRLPPEVERRTLGIIPGLAVLRMLARFGVLRLLASLGLARTVPWLDRMPAETQRVAKALAVRTSGMDALHGEVSAVQESLAQARAGRRNLGDLPVAVITAGAQYVPSRYPRGFPLEESKRVWLELQEELAGLSSRSKQVIGEESSHYVQEDQPELVVDAIRWVVGEARRSQSRS